MNETQASTAGVFCYGLVWEPPEISFFPQAEGKRSAKACGVGGACVLIRKKERCHTINITIQEGTRRGPRRCFAVPVICAKSAGDMDGSMRTGSR